MPALNVKATRMELLTLKKRIKIARRGHKLLKDKRDELMREFLAVVRENATLRKEVEEKLAGAYRKMALAQVFMGTQNVEAAFAVPPELSVTVGEENKSSVRVPNINVEDMGSSMHEYGVAFTSPILDEALTEFKEVMEDLLKLSARERGIELMAAEIERTRRRVNALEHVLLPQLEEGAKYIQMKLDELERSTFSNLMRIKSISK